jgi:hypothetical protein
MLVVICLTSLTMAFATNAAEPIFTPFQTLLDQHLEEISLPDDGLVTAFDYTYALTKDETKSLLAKQREHLADFDTDTLGGKAESVAFWINAYNFFMLEQVLTNRPNGKLVSSVWDYGGRVNPFVGSVFDLKRFTVGGRKYSLNQIEKDILLGHEYAGKGWKDARVHFAVNCASVGCPPLRNSIYTAENLERVLTENTRRGLSTARHLRVENNTLYVTQLFKWYEDDFKTASGSTKAYIEKWADSGVLERVANTSDIQFIDYDWTLNSPANFPELR